MSNFTVVYTGVHGVSKFLPFFIPTLFNFSFIDTLPHKAAGSMCVDLPSMFTSIFSL